MELSEVKEEKEAFFSLVESGIGFYEAVDLALFVKYHESAREFLCDAYPEEVDYLENNDNTEDISFAIYGDGVFAGEDDRPLSAFLDQKDEIVKTLKAKYLGFLMKNATGV